MLVAGLCAQVSLQVEAAGALGVPGIQHLQTRGLGVFFSLFPSLRDIIRSSGVHGTLDQPGMRGGSLDLGSWNPPSKEAPLLHSNTHMHAKNKPQSRLPWAAFQGLRTDGLWRVHTWMTTSEESTTLYSSPQMRRDCPFSNTPRRPADFSPSHTSGCCSFAASCVSTYLQSPLSMSTILQSAPLITRFRSV